MIRETKRERNAPRHFFQEWSLPAVFLSGSLFQSDFLPCFGQKVHQLSFLFQNLSIPVLFSGPFTERFFNRRVQPPTLVGGSAVDACYSPESSYGKFVPSVDFTDLRRMALFLLPTLNFNIH